LIALDDERWGRGKRDLADCNAKQEHRSADRSEMNQLLLEKSRRTTLAESAAGPRMPTQPNDLRTAFRTEFWSVHGGTPRLDFCQSGRCDSRKV
jgi:hypothetical protein